MAKTIGEMASFSYVASTQMRLFASPIFPGRRPARGWLTLDQQVDAGVGLVAHVCGDHWKCKCVLQLAASWFRRPTFETREVGTDHFNIYTLPDNRRSRGFFKKCKRLWL